MPETRTLLYMLCITAILGMSPSIARPRLERPAVLYVLCCAVKVLLSLLLLTAGVSAGGHLNPAVTFGFLVARKITLQRAACYWVAQVSWQEAGLTRHTSQVCSAVVVMLSWRSAGVSQPVLEAWA